MLPIRNVGAITAELRHNGGGLSSYLLMRYNLALTCLSLYLLLTDFVLLLLMFLFRYRKYNNRNCSWKKLYLKMKNFDLLT